MGMEQVPARADPFAGTASTDDKTTPLASVLEPGEQVIWIGRPQVELAVSSRLRFRRVLQLASIPVTLVLLYWLLPENVGLRELVPSMGMQTLLAILVPFVVIALFFVFKQDTASQLNRYFQGLSYAITDRRLLIFDGDRLAESYGPERVSKPYLKERFGGRSDVIFGQRAILQQQRSAVTREHARIGFKALSDAAEVKTLIEKWLEDNLQKAERDVADHLEAPPPEIDTSSGRRRIANHEVGLALEVPVSWRTRVRKKKKPVGSFFFDREDWQSPDDAREWNALLAEGPAKCKIELEVFETAPTVTYESLMSSRMADAVAGKVVASDPDIEINGIRGFSVTRRTDLAIDSETHAAGVAAIVAPQRLTVLHDGRRQIYILSSWPEDSPQLERAVDAVVKSVRLD